MSRAGLARAAVLTLLMLLCWALALAGLGRVTDSGAVTLYLPEMGYSYDELYKAEQRAAQPAAFAAWNQLEGQRVACTELERSKTLSVLSVYGDSTLALPDLPMLLPNSNACLLDSASCYELFGDFSPIGGRVELAGESYTIVGVFEHPGGMLVRQGRGSDTGWNRVTLSLAGSPDRAGAAAEFAMRHGLAPYAVVSSGLWRGLAELFTQLMPLLALFSIAFAGLRLTFARRATPVLAGLTLLLTLGAATLFWLVCGLGFAVPPSLIPARWSDFEFWTAAIADILAQLWLALTLPKELVQSIPMLAALKCMLWGTASALLYPACLCRLRRVLRQIKTPPPTV